MRRANVFLERGNRSTFRRFACCRTVPYHGRIDQGTDGCFSSRPQFSIGVMRPRDTQHNEETRE